jgi:hypothetical protein
LKRAGDSGDVFKGEMMRPTVARGKVRLQVSIVDKLRTRPSSGPSKLLRKCVRLQGVLMTSGLVQPLL